MSTAALANPNGTNVPNIIPLEEGWNNEIKAKVRPEDVVYTYIRR